MSTSTSDRDNTTKTDAATVKAPSTGAEKRRRRRVKMSAPVLVSAKDRSPSFKEVCKSADTSRDGLLFTSSRAGYCVGQILDITFPYTSWSDACNRAQSAEVIRVDKLPDKTFNVAVHFHTGKEAGRANAKSAASGPYISAIGERFRSTASQSKSPSVVLAVAPDASTADLIRDALNPDGYTVVVVTSAEAALEAMRTSVPAVLIAEAESEGMSGLELCATIKADEKLKSVPVILMTPNVNPSDYSSSRSMGAVMCVVKPVKPAKLQQLVRLIAPPPTGSSAYGARIYGGSVERAL